MPKENNVRKGFSERWEFLALRDALHDYFKGVVTFAYKTGWRESEIFDLQWAQIYMGQGIVSLNAGETKNDDARTVYLDEELKQVFQTQWELRKRKGVLTQFVFASVDGTGRIKRFSWSLETSMY